MSSEIAVDTTPKTTDESVTETAVETHPLNTAWTMWYDSNTRKPTEKNWSANLKGMITIDTVEDFWGTFKNIPRASELATGANYHLFREGVRPEWEDSNNTHGGRWIIAYPEGRRNDVDQLWLNTLLACIGELFEVEDCREICGAVFAVRRSQFRLSIWTRNAADVELQRRIGKTLLEVLHARPNQLEYQVHHPDEKTSLLKDSYKLD